MLILSVLWYKARNQLDNAQKKQDIDRVTKQDLFSLCLLLIGYIFIYLFPHLLTLAIYFGVSFLIGLLIAINYYRWLKKQNYPRHFIRETLFFSTLMFYATMWLGILLLV